MTSKVLGLVAVLLFSFSLTFAQDDMKVIGDEMTKDPEQNAQWREGQTPYPSKPKNMWELGLYGGASNMIGDVDSEIGFNAGLTVRKAISYVLSIRFGGNYSSTKGYDARPTSFDNFSKERIYKENVGKTPALANYEGENVHRNFETNLIAGNLELLVSIGNIMFHRPDPQWNAYVGLGVGYHQRTVSSDLLTNGTADIYDFASATAGVDLETRDGRNTARDNVKSLLDGDFETEGGSDATSGEGFIHGIASLGITRKLGGRVNLGLEYQIILTGDDLLDGYQANSRSADFLQYFNLRLGFNLGNKEKRTEPLYWVNPLDATLNDVAELKQRPKFDLTDSDGDGVIDMIDQEPNTTAGCPVDTRGIILDSDGDGIPDCKDVEPFSPPGYTVDSEGKANVTTPWLTESEVRAIVNERPLPKTEWFLPMVHFDLDKYYIKPQYYSQLASVAQVMNTHPDLRIKVTGYHDNRGKPDYNNVLAYNRAEAIVNALVERMNIPRNRLVIAYSSDQLIADLPDNYSTSYEEERGQYMNRRVEFTIAGDNDSDAARPEGEAGSDTPGSSREGAKFSGNRNSGY